VSAVAQPAAVPEGTPPAPTRPAVRREPLVLFAVAFAGYGVLGYFVMLRWHIIVGDGVSRLLHAYFIWYNQPPKLAAVGFVWPPLMTIVLLPFAVVKPLATSMLALPLASALFAAGLVVVIERTLALFGLSRIARLPLVALIALNPMILYYAANGMGESLSLFLLSLAVYWFLHWYKTPTHSRLVLMSLALACGVVARYEILFWAFALGAAVLAVLYVRGAGQKEIEGSAVAVFAPVVYALGLWIFFNWLIIGHPFYWLNSEVTQTFVETRRQVVQSSHVELAAAAVRTLGLTWHLFPATLIVVAALVVASVWCRDLVALVLASTIALNPITTAVLGVATHTDVVFQLRYNLRAVPLVLVGLGWLYHLAPRRARVAVWLVSAGLLAGSVPSTWQTMQTWQQQALEQAFLRAITTGKDQEGTHSLGLGVPVGNAPEQAAARWIGDHVHGRNAVLADDAASFEVILLTGNPGLFLDRTDHGDAVWLDALDSPFGRTRFFLVSQQGHDLIKDRYPTVLEGRVGWLQPVWKNARWTVLRVRPRPRAG
jgi:hypothetical protein